MKKILNKINPFYWADKNDFEMLFMSSTLGSPFWITDLIVNKHPLYLLDVPCLLLVILYGYKALK